MIRASRRRSRKPALERDLYFETRAIITNLEFNLKSYFFGDGNVVAKARSLREPSDSARFVGPSAGEPSVIDDGVSHLVPARSRQVVTHIAESQQA